MVSLEQLGQLQTPLGTQVLGDLHVEPPTPATTIPVATRLRKSYPAELVTAAMTIHELRLKARAKFSRADAMWFTRAGLEQATAEPIATCHAARFAGLDQITDLCCGVGGDLVALGSSHPFASLTAVDLDAVHLAMAHLNAAVYGITDRVQTVQADVRSVNLDPDGGVFIDPARRSERGRMALGESEPPLEWCLGLATGDRAVGIKCAPGLDHDRVPEGWEFEAIALGTDLKEAVLWSPPIACSTRSATVIDGATHRLEPVPGEPVGERFPAVGDTLIDPNPAITRAGLVEDLARSLRAQKIDAHIGFLVSDVPLTSPFGRSLTVVASEPWNERALKTRLRELGAGPIDIRRRGLAGDVDAITKRLRGKGGRPLTIAMTRVMNQPWAVICESSQIANRPRNPAVPVLPFS